MKKLVFLAMIVLAIILIGANGTKAQECQEAQTAIENAETGQIQYFGECQDPALSREARWQCRLDKYCGALWTIQPLLELYWIPRIQNTLTGGTCEWYAFGIAIDVVFWIPLACVCNKDTFGCGNWTYDFAYNSVSYYRNCR